MGRRIALFVGLPGHRAHVEKRLKPAGLKSVIVVVMVPVATMVTMTVIAAIIIVMMPLVAIAALALTISQIAFSHPLLLHKIHGLPAGSIAPAVATPVSLVDNGHVKVDRILINDHRSWCDHHRLCIDDWRCRVVADVDAPINTRLIDADRHTYTGSGKHG